MKVFAHLRATRTFRRRHLGFLETREDHDIVQEIGYHEEAGKPLTLKQLQMMGITSLPTLQRRLRRLRDVGAVVSRRMDGDARAVELTLSSKVMRTYHRYGDLIRRMNAELPPGSGDGESSAP